MPDHDEVVAFAEAVQSHMPEHDVLKAVPASRVALLAKDEDTWVPTLQKDSDFWAEDVHAGA
jgi:tRNA wybutosine-synthesizing protein 1